MCNVLRHLGVARVLYAIKFCSVLDMSCCGNMEQLCATEGTLNTLNFKKSSVLLLFYVYYTVRGQKQINPMGSIFRDTILLLLL